MPAPRTEKEVRSFLGSLQYISRFISRMTSVCEPIFKLLRKKQPLVWDDKCQITFKRIKAYLMQPPVLRPPVPGKPLTLYLAIEDASVGAMLVQEQDDGSESAVYYLSKKLLDYEVKYPLVEKTCVTMVWLTKKL